MEVQFAAESPGFLIQFRPDLIRFVQAHFSCRDLGGSFGHDDHVSHEGLETT